MTGKKKEDSEIDSFRPSTLQDKDFRYYNKKKKRSGITKAIRSCIRKARLYDEENRKNGDIEPQSIEPPECGYVFFWEEGASCLRNLRSPITKTKLRKSKLENLVCEACLEIEKIRTEERQLKKINSDRPFDVAPSMEEINHTIHQGSEEIKKRIKETENKERQNKEDYVVRNNFKVYRKKILS